MSDGYTVDDLLDFLTHASDKGLIPVATATALGVGARNVLGMIEGPEREDVRRLDLDAVVRRFTNKRARDFSPSSLKEYARRVHRAVDLFVSWRADPANFVVRTRVTKAPARDRPISSASPPTEAMSPRGTAGYQSSFPIRPGIVVTMLDIPSDLTPTEAERLASFIRMLPVG